MKHQAFLKKGPQQCWELQQKKYLNFLILYPIMNHLQLFLALTFYDSRFKFLRGRCWLTYLRQNDHFFFSGEGGHFVSSTKIKQNEEWVSLQRNQVALTRIKENRNELQRILQNKLQKLNVIKILPNPIDICNVEFKNLLIKIFLCHLKNIKDYQNLQEKFFIIILNSYILQFQANSGTIVVYMVVVVGEQ